ncbi:hypothetical protein KC345_g10921, partial [Hortaea werneckii]
YEVTQNKGTEPPYQNEYWNHFGEGIYTDIISGDPLFSSEGKFDSGTGWPSFSKPVEEGLIRREADYSGGEVRTALRSRLSGAYLGHLFYDGPEPAKLHYRVNSAALQFIPKAELAENGLGRISKMVYSHPTEPLTIYWAKYEQGLYKTVATPDRVKTYLVLEDGIDGFTIKNNSIYYYKGSMTVEPGVYRMPLDGKQAEARINAALMDTGDKSFRYYIGSADMSRRDLYFPLVREKWPVTGEPYINQDEIVQDSEEAVSQYEVNYSDYIGDRDSDIFVFNERDEDTGSSYLHLFYQGKETVRRIQEWIVEPLDILQGWVYFTVDKEISGQGGLFAIRPDGSGAMDMIKVIAAIETAAKNNNIIDSNSYREVHSLYHAIIETIQSIGRGIVQFGDILRTVGLTFAIVRGKMSGSVEHEGEWIAVCAYGTIDNQTVIVRGNTLTIEEVVRVARYHRNVELSEESCRKVDHTRKYVEKLLLEKKVVYGLTTGFGKFSDTYISPEDTKQLQLNLIRSHSCGIGEPFTEEIVRAILLLRVNALSLGYSGIRLEVIRLMVEMLNRNVVPVIPEKGSLGASGDLAPLSHMVLVLIGEGEACYQGVRMPGGQALAKAGLAPIELAAKEGLALINGTQVMTAVGTLACWDALNLANWADCTAALTCEALRAVRDAFDPATH